MAGKVILDFEKPLFELEAKLEEMRVCLRGSAREQDQQDADMLHRDIALLEQKVDALRRSIYKNLTRWQKVQLARHPERPYTLDYIYMMTRDFVELSGDRHFKDDKAIVGGFARLEESASGFSQTVMMIGHQKGRDTKSNLYRNFGMAQPEGYRKALRLMKLAEKFRKPVITLIDTPGAFPGIEAEERGQAEAIARNLFEMARLSVPIICVIIGEGASGGAIGIGVGDRVFMAENSWYSVISPESCSSILWRSWNYKEQAAEALKLTADDLLRQGIIDRIVPEPLGGAHTEPEAMAGTLKEMLVEELRDLMSKESDVLVRERVDKFSGMGVWDE
ncbi:MAG: acetyl-CoA carboxylase carboxyltransferase subunit alpha [Chlorobium limicola]|uniref:Acetyl-coenzyme A carboxylase carboxyl transferase subunit alpha n=1 Tax=Chlorobium limicola (strain DSM 245 / NBRC 103803 / 6330) TaxID=290315 RepID=ACCA_CHLL2|nr:acetyl-CoA carboxylase carboxyltransferase subunit alpha [Chlorobium limicola]B3EER8.1 RecName: Full=Acetyl-coenzyme A carboxylase carboxyl transferase subunit alpha; Short=ACCase subunit alpha; Short=Acetyl-CoA carboxylase carboxyltransferase subunit alpha [Chlorobium limicola DSM 245]ACD89301.1 acetyl-CoA carboxylase, carboxyl transferase, alpha subunit [Chlorobium limicola DSM 245]NTV20873.1 acetyl-CoA carboxylase carboxyltransferase subunit alpha [Chlorobium limicola]